ncbi:MAG: dTDP-4-dehydrorhamnose 3,5-epimerase [Hyphomicrobiaceae bacterium]
MLGVRQLALDGVLEILPQKHGDARGFFCETWSRATFAAAGIELDFVQDNHSLSVCPGTLRGLHYQCPPYAQAKLVRVVRGAIFDVAVDIRQGSPSFAQWVGVEVSSARGNQLLVPRGFAHGFITVSENTEVIYKVDAAYSREHDKVIRYDDVAIGITWPVVSDTIHLSDKDRDAPLLAETDTGFSYP